MSITTYYENVLLDRLDTVSVYAQLHTGDPTELATSHVASNSTRKVVTFSAADSGFKTSNSAVQWTNVPAAETYSHMSLWDAATNGNPLYFGELENPRSVETGDSFTLNSGSLVVTLD